MKIYSVSELNTEAREAMLLAFQYPITVKGEISDYRSSRGHQYFKLRDNSTSNTVSCVMWKNSLNTLDIDLLSFLKYHNDMDILPILYHLNTYKDY